MSTTDFRGGTGGGCRRWISNPGAGRTPRGETSRYEEAMRGAHLSVPTRPRNEWDKDGIRLPVISWPSGREREGSMGRETSGTRTRRALLK